MADSSCDEAATRRGTVTSAVRTIALRHRKWPPKATRGSRKLGELDVKVSDLARRPGEGGESGMVDQLERLARLHSAGELDDAEYSSAKSKLLKE